MPDPNPARGFLKTIQEGIIDVQKQSGLPGNLQELPKAMATIFNVVIFSAAVLFMLMFLFGGFTYLSAAGNEETTARAKRMMVDSIVGLIVTIASYAIAVFILGKFGYKGP